MPATVLASVGFELTIDANQAYRPKAAARLVGKVADLGVEIFEQPLQGSRLISSALPPTGREAAATRQCPGILICTVGACTAGSWTVGTRTVGVGTLIVMVGA
jgi:hypothetical protein